MSILQSTRNITTSCTFISVLHNYKVRIQGKWGILLRLVFEVFSHYSTCIDGHSNDTNGEANEVTQTGDQQQCTGLPFLVTIKVNKYLGKLFCAVR